jgi:hypothetical protein
MEGFSRWSLLGGTSLAEIFLEAGESCGCDRSDGEYC